MNISLLTQQPISGTILERHFSVFRGANLWVRFEDDVEEPWIGVFGMGDVSPYCAAVPFDDDGGRTVLVVAGGQGYIVDRISGTLLRETGWFYSYSALAPPTRDFVIVADTQHIWAVAETTMMRARLGLPSLSLCRISIRSRSTASCSSDRRMLS